MLLVTQLHCLPSLHNSINGVVYCQFIDCLEHRMESICWNPVNPNHWFMFESNNFIPSKGLWCLACDTKHCLFAYLQHKISDSGSFSNHGLAHVPCPNNKTNWWVQACAMKNPVVVMLAVHCDLWVSMNGARKCVDLNKMVNAVYQFVAGLSVLFVWRHKRLAGIGILYQPTLVVAPWIGDGFCCWFMIDCTIQLSIHMVRGGSIAFGTGGKHGIHDFVSVAHIWWCSCAGSPVLLRFPPWVSERSWHVSLTCYVIYTLMLYRRHLCFWNILLPSSKWLRWQVWSRLESGDLVWGFQWDTHESWLDQWSDCLCYSTLRIHGLGHSCHVFEQWHGPHFSICKAVPVLGHHVSAWAAFSLSEKKYINGAAYSCCRDWMTALYFIRKRVQF